MPARKKNNRAKASSNNKAKVVSDVSVAPEAAAPAGTVERPSREELVQRVRKLNRVSRTQRLAASVRPTPEERPDCVSDEVLDVLKFIDVLRTGMSGVAIPGLDAKQLDDMEKRVRSSPGMARAVKDHFERVIMGAMGGMAPGAVAPVAPAEPAELATPPAMRKNRPGAAQTDNAAVDDIMREVYGDGDDVVDDFEHINADDVVVDEGGKICADVPTADGVVDEEEGEACVGGVCALPRDETCPGGVCALPTADAVVDGESETCPGGVCALPTADAEPEE
jgi:hypothetical protein